MESKLPKLTRRHFLQDSLAATGILLAGPCNTAWAGYSDAPQTTLGFTRIARWLKSWETYIVQDSRSRTCDHAMGEDLGWLVSPYLYGFYYGYLATNNTVWIDRLIDWSHAWVSRAVKEPDDFPGWPAQNGACTSAVPNLYTDNILGEAMALRPMVLMAGLINRTPSLKSKYALHAKTWINLAEDIFTKWKSRHCWREIKSGGVWVAPTFGIDQSTNGWTAGYTHRATDGFTLPANKQNLVAQWVIALHDVTGKPIYQQCAEDWWRTMLSRIQPHHVGRATYVVWNYWDPAGPWDYQANGATKLWVGVHPNGGYYAIDVAGMVTAFQHHLIFDQTRINCLIVTNRDYMWNHRIHAASFQRIDGGADYDSIKLPIKTEQFTHMRQLARHIYRRN